MIQTSLDGQALLVAGSSSGIGQTIARQLVGGGARVALMARRMNRLEALAADLNQARPGSACVAAGDVSLWADCQSAVQTAVGRFGQLHGLVNAAGAWCETPFIDVSSEELRQFVDTDVTGALQISRAILPHLRKNEGGSIILLNGLQGRISCQPPVLYAAVENAARGFCESLRWEARTYGVHVGLITLGAVANEEPPEFISGARDGHGRIAISRGEVADAVAYMLSRPSGVNIDEIAITPLHEQKL